MANRNLPASAVGNPGAARLNHATAKQKSKVTRYDPANVMTGQQVRTKGPKSPGAPHAVTGAEATDLFTSTAHGFTTGDEVRFTALTGGAGITPGTSYYVIASGLTANAFKVSATPGGTTIDFTTDLTVGTVTRWRYTYVCAPNVHEGRVLPEVPGPRSAGRVD